MSATLPPVGSRVAMAWSTSRRANVDACAVNP